MQTLEFSKSLFTLYSRYDAKHSTVKGSLVQNLSDLVFATSVVTDLNCCVQREFVTGSTAIKTQTDTDICGKICSSAMTFGAGVRELS